MFSESVNYLNLQPDCTCPLNELRAYILGIYGTATVTTFNRMIQSHKETFELHYVGKFRYVCLRGHWTRPESYRGYMSNIREE